MGLIALLFYVLTVAAQWVVFQKAGIAGWKSIIPIFYIVLAFSEDNYIGPNGNRIYVA